MSPMYHVRQRNGCTVDWLRPHPHQVREARSEAMATARAVGAECYEVKNGIQTRIYPVG
jgi:hypothetical protein